MGTSQIPSKTIDLTREINKTLYKSMESPKKAMQPLYSELRERFPMKIGTQLANRIVYNR